MTERVIRITVDSSGAVTGIKKIENAAEKAGDEAKKTKKEFADLGNLIRVAIGGAVIREFTRLSDSFTLVNNRIRLVTEGAGEFNAVQRELVDLSNETRTSLTSTAELYGRVARSTDELGLSQRDVIELTRTVNQAIQVSGATAQEASAGVIQFAQGLASGALRGDELRSVLEQMPRLAKALSDGLGVGIGELRKLGEQGKLTTADIVGALKDQAPEIAEEFTKLTPTIESAFTVFQNGLTVLVGRFNEATGTGDAFAKVLQAVGVGLIDVADTTALFAQALTNNVSKVFNDVVSSSLQATNAISGFFKEVVNDAAQVIADLAGNPAARQILKEQRKQIQNEIADTAVAIEKQRKDIQAQLTAKLKRDRLKFFELDTDALDDVSGGLKKIVKETDEVRKAREKAEAAGIKFNDGLREQIDILRLEAELGDKAAGAVKELRLQNRLAAIDVNVHTAAGKELIATLIEQQRLADVRELGDDREDSLQGLRDELAVLSAIGDERLKILAVQELGAEATQAELDEFVALSKEIDVLSAKQKEMKDFTEELVKDSARFFKESTRDFLTGTLDDFGSLRNNFGQLLQNLAADFLASSFLKLLSDVFNNLGSGGGGGIFSTIATGLGGLFGGAQHGAPVQGGKPTFVNEGRGEVFIPANSGQVQPIGQFANQDLGNKAPTIIIDNNNQAAALEAQNTAQGQQVFRVMLEENADFAKQVLGVPT